MSNSPVSRFLGAATALSVAMLSMPACGAPVVRQQQPIIGAVSDTAGRAEVNATVTFINLATGAVDLVARSDERGQIRGAIAAGSYSITATTSSGYAWLEDAQVGSGPVVVSMDRACERVTGRLRSRAIRSARVDLESERSGVRERYVTYTDDAGVFQLCLPKGEYTASAVGSILAPELSISIPYGRSVELKAYPAEDVRAPLEHGARVRAGLDTLVRDIDRRSPLLVGLGEATHGSAEFFSARATLILELARRSQLRHVLLEADAITAMELDRYVNGADLDVRKAVAGLGFWLTNTKEFTQVVEDIRRYNLGAGRDDEAKIHIWGIDAQNTRPAVEVLLANSARLALSEAEIAVVTSLADQRGKRVKELGEPERAALRARLEQLAVPASAASADLQVALAALSMRIQIGYFEGDVEGLYGARRDEGMAHIAKLILDTTHARRACLWAHNDHVSRKLEAGFRSLGEVLSTMFPGRYYPIAFYMYQGSARAWDAAGKIGIISHAVKPAPEFTVEGALMAASGSPEVAWVSLGELPATLRAWFALPRYVREMGAVYHGEARTMILLDILPAFDALVVIKHVHDSTPVTPAQPSK